MARAVKQFLAERQSIAVRVDTAAFHTGFVEGMTGSSDRFDIRGVASEAEIVEIIRNLTELAAEGDLTEEWLRRDVGMIVGWLYRPEVKVGLPVPDTNGRMNK